METRAATGTPPEDRKVRVNVRILGEEYVIRGDPNTTPEYIKRIAQQVDERLRAVSAINPRLPRSHLVVLACLNIMDELEKLKASYDELLKLIGEGREL